MTDARRRPNGPRRYVRLSRLQAGEDERREYKGHRCLSCEEIPQRFKHSRRAISRNINGFLNTGHGGKIFMGVLDDGTVAGLRLSDAQKDHISIALDDLMRRYTPPVSQSCYRLSFVPVWGEEKEEEEAGRERDSGVSLDCSDEEVSSPADTPAHSSGRELRSRGHLLRSARFCWCDRDTRDMILRGESIPFYVVEISILPFVRDPRLPPMVCQLHPIYQNEQGRCYLRGSTSLLECSYQKVAELTVAEVEAHFTKIKKKLRAEMKFYMTNLTSALVNLALREAGDCHTTRCDRHMTRQPSGSKPIARHWDNQPK